MTAGRSISEELAKLADLRDRGDLSEEEFSELKADLLSGQMRGHRNTNSVTRHRRFSFVVAIVVILAIVGGGSFALFALQSHPAKPHKGKTVTPQTSSVIATTGPYSVTGDFSVFTEGSGVSVCIPGEDNPQCANSTGSTCASALERYGFGDFMKGQVDVTASNGAVIRTGPLLLVTPMEGPDASCHFTFTVRGLPRESQYGFSVGCWGTTWYTFDELSQMTYTGPSAGGLVHGEWGILHLAVNDQPGAGQNQTYTCPTTAATTTTSPGLLPAFLSCPDSSLATVRPSGFQNISCGEEIESGTVKDITWSSWSATSASGQGVATLCSQYPFGCGESYPVNLRLAMPQETAYGYVFTVIQETCATTQSPACGPAVYALPFSNG